MWMNYLLTDLCLCYKRFTRDIRNRIHLFLMLENVASVSDNRTPHPRTRCRVTLPFDMNDRIYRFGEFELLTNASELRTRNSCVRLQEKPLQLLLILVENPQRVVTRR